MQNVKCFLKQFLDKLNMFMTEPDFCAGFMGADLPVTLYNKVPIIHLTKNLY